MPSTLLLAGGVHNPPSTRDGPMPWGLLAAVPLFLVGIPLAIGGVVMGIAAIRIGKKAADHIPGALMLVLGAGIVGLGWWLA